MDPYRTLNVPRFDQAAIKQAYRKLAKMLHRIAIPAARAEQRFEVSQARPATDPVKRARYDRGEIDAEGRPQQTFRGFEFADDPQSAAESIFGKMFGGAFGRGFGEAARRGLGTRSEQFRFDDLRREAAGAAAPAPADPSVARTAATGSRSTSRRRLGGKQRSIWMAAARSRSWSRPARNTAARCASKVRARGDRRVGPRATPWSRSGSGRIRRSRARVTTCTSNCRSACRSHLGRERPGADHRRPGPDHRAGRQQQRAHAEAQGPRHRAAGWPPRRPVRPAARGPAASAGLELEAWAKRRNYDVRRHHEPR